MADKNVLKCLFNSLVTTYSSSSLDIDVSSSTTMVQFISLVIGFLNISWIFIDIILRNKCYSQIDTAL